MLQPLSVQTVTPHWAGACKQPAHSRYPKVSWSGFEPGPTEWFDRSGTCSNLAVMSTASNPNRDSARTICCELVVEFVLLTGQLTEISTTLVPHDDTFDVAAACGATNIAPAAAVGGGVRWSSG